MKRLTAIVVMLLGLTACSPTAEVVDAAAAPTQAAEAVASASARPDSAGAGSADRDGGGADAGPPMSASARSDSAPVGSAGRDQGGADDEPPGSTGNSPDPPVEMTSVTIHLTRGERLASVTRRVPRVPRIGSAALEQLFQGPTPEEEADGYGTQIPAGTRLRDLAITDGVATVDLSSEFEEGGGTLALTVRLAQVVCTLDEFPTVDGVRFAIDGTVVDVFSGDGLIIDEPVACSDYAEVAEG
jgi:hypothetical protein